jgi:ribosomal protein L7/L12
MGFFDKPEQLGNPGSVDAQRLDQLEARVRQLEATVALLAQQGVAPAAPGAVAAAAADPSAAANELIAQIRRLKAEGNLIEAIKLYRQATNVGLKEAKDAVEAM